MCLGVGVKGFEHVVCSFANREGKFNANFVIRKMHIFDLFQSSYLLDLI